MYSNFTSASTDVILKLDKGAVDVITGTLSGFLERTVIELNSLRGFRSTRGKSTSIHNRVIEKTKELLEVLEDFGNYYGNIGGDFHGDATGELKSELIEGGTGSDNETTYSCNDMTLTLMNCTDSNATQYSSDLEMTCTGSDFGVTPITGIKSILKSGVKIMKNNSSRKVRFEGDALNVTWEAIVDNKENLNISVCSEYLDSKMESTSRNDFVQTVIDLPSNIRKLAKRTRTLKGKSAETWDVWQNGESRGKSWSSIQRSREHAALRDIKTLVELGNDNRNKGSSQKPKSVRSPGKKMKRECSENLRSVLINYANFSSSGVQNEVLANLTQVDDTLSLPA